MHLVKLKGTTIIIFLTVKEKFANLRTTVIKKKSENSPQRKNL